jgi:nitrite reductase/ring-hydroxylating ferredoxin subunit
LGIVGGGGVGLFSLGSTFWAGREPTPTGLLRMVQNLSFKQKYVMWVEITALDRVPEWGVLPVKVEEILLILNRQGMKVACYRNACTHLEYPIDMGKVSNGTITCPFHKFRYELESGKCLNAPADPLESFPVKIEGDRVFVEIL